ncbi:acetylornithine deacetylase [Candidatus Pantoea edessiphila]|uniref:Acetylornithine deacetylase n=1 Tax=Candidatus Pantoea edessiphila TaxID=2044610 RepID=A0A2P5T0E6_9GAMM|nr:acetylornithine deacetylase [Candidatus Pantoea edessiphila]PPI88022.1 acetylornithine deacetylase [Candidatus Pantoea edessiphila]
MKTRLPSFFECYRKLISIPSVSSIDPKFDNSNKLLIDILASWFYDLGLSIEIYPILNTNNKFNLLAKTGSGLGGLMLAGHTDTVPFDPNSWKYDPFVLTEFNNKLYGLGTVDMKGFFAFIIDVLRNVDIKTLRKPLYILATADEETTMVGAKNFSESIILNPDIAIIGEPTDLKLVYEHRGHISNIIRITGDSGHSSNLYKCVNAIEIMQQVIKNLIKLRNSIEKNNCNRSINPPYILNFGYIKGGDVSNSVCSYCELHIDIRFLSNITIIEVNKFIHDALEPIKKNWPNRIIIDELHSSVPAYKCSTSNFFVRKIKKLLNTNFESVNYCTEAPFIQKLCPTLIFGPGSINQAHQPNEFMDTSYIKPTYKNIYQMIHYFCN